MVDRALVADFYEEDHTVRILVALIGILALVPYAVIQLTVLYYG